MDVDLVVTWVTDTDEQWCARRDDMLAKWRTRASGAEVSPGTEAACNPSRHRDWYLFPYWFRSVEAFAPWARRIYVVTEGHLPDWLNREHPRIRTVAHHDFMPADYLPTFQSVPIELNVHRIPGLAEQFVLFNDDMFLTAPTTLSTFFAQNEHPRLPVCMGLATVPTPDVAFTHTMLNNGALITKHFNVFHSMRQNPRLWLHPSNGLRGLLNTVGISIVARRFMGLRHTHLAMPHLRSTFEHVWEQESEVLDDTCRHPFRTFEDVNHWVMADWNVMEGHAWPMNATRAGRVVPIDDSLTEERLRLFLADNPGPQVCLNDGWRSPHDNTEMRAMLHRVMQDLFPEPSSFELHDAVPLPQEVDR